MGVYRETCDEQVMSRITTKERAKLNKLAKKNNLTPSRMIRLLIQRARS